MKLTVIIPVYNERGTILELLSRVQAVGIEKEILIIDDGSTDGTRELLRTVSAPDVEVFYHPRNQGKGASVRTGIARARGEYVIVQDADLEYDPGDYSRLLTAAETHGWPVVFGSRLRPDADNREWSRWFRFGRRFLTWVFRVLYRCAVTDVATCYKLMRTEVVQRLRLRSSGFDLDFELPAKLCRAGVPIHEAPINYYPRSMAQGKKIRARHGLSAVYTLIKYRFVD